MSKTHDEDEDNRIRNERNSDAERIRYELTRNAVQLSNMRARLSHQFADSIGGHSSNYKF
jgi:hypothetical protein